MQNPNKPKVLFVGAFPPPHRNVIGGNVTDCKILLESSFSNRADLCLLDSTQISNPAPNFFIRLIYAIRRLLFFFFLFEWHKPDAVLLFTGSGIGLLEKGLMAMYAKIRSGHAFLFPRGGGILEKYKAKSKLPFWVKIAFGGASKIFCQGHIMENFLLSRLNRNPSDFVVINNWTATQELIGIGQNRLISTKPPIHLLFVGWLEKEKGVYDLLEAVKLLREELDLRLDFVGDGAARANLSNLILSYGLSSVITIHGWKKSETLKDFYKSSDVFVLPSWIEGLPNALVEAMASGLCVIASNVGNIPEVIKNNDNGLLVNPKNVIELASAIKLASTDNELRYRVGRAAHRMAKNNFSVEIAAERLVSAMLNSGHE